MTKDEMKNRISLALKDPILQQGFEIICKENAELKKQQFSLRNERNTFLAENEQYEKDLIDFNENLTKAKEIIKEIMSFSVQLCDCRHTEDFEKAREKAEQFIKEIE